MTFNFSTNSINLWEVFQGFITFEPASAKSCPLANRDKPFYLSNENQSLFIRSSYQNDSLVYEKKCKWDFEGPKNHSFKIKIFHMESEILIVANGVRQFIKR